MGALAVSLDQPATYWQVWEWISVSVPNLIWILVMVGLFVGALVIPFPKGEDES